MTDDQIIEKMMEFVRYSENCWEWTGTLNRKYGSFYHPIKKRFVRSHRLSYVYFHGEKLGDLNCCHHCDNPACINPFHLFAATQRENVKDCLEKGRKWRKKFTNLYCHRGHLKAGDNLLIKKGGRACRKCYKEFHKK